MTFAINGECGGPATQDTKLTAHFAREMGSKLIWQQLGNKNGKD